MKILKNDFFQKLKINQNCISVVKMTGYLTIGDSNERSGDLHLRVSGESTKIFHYNRYGQLRFFTCRMTPSPWNTGALLLKVSKNVWIITASDFAWDVLLKHRQFLQYWWNSDKGYYWKITQEYVAHRRSGEAKCRNSRTFQDGQGRSK